MKYRVYIFMGIDECGDSFRAHGNKFLEGEYRFPDYTGDEAMWEAFLSWEEAMVRRANDEWQELYGSECRIHMEETYLSQFQKDCLFHGL